MNSYTLIYCKFCFFLSIHFPLKADVETLTSP